ncbi:hypothetical protein ABIA00_004462 [Bradyrhizobium ottawaense]
MRWHAALRRADSDLCRGAGFREALQGVAKARPAGVEGGARRRIARRDVVEHENVGGTGRIAMIVVRRPISNRPASIMAASIRRMLLSIRVIRERRSAAINRRLSVSSIAMSGGVPAKFSMDILRTPQLGTLPLLVR